MGKTEMGNYLQDHCGFKHLDFESETTLTRYLGAGEVGFRDRVADLKRTGRDVVITWGFVPDVQLTAVLALRSLGFILVWFDGNRAAARREYLKVGRPKNLLARQLSKIAIHVDLKVLAPIVINTFDANGDFRSRDQIALQLLETQSFGTSAAVQKPID